MRCITITVPNFMDWQEKLTKSTKSPTWLAFDLSFYADPKIELIQNKDPRATHVFLWVLTELARAKSDSIELSWDSVANTLKRIVGIKSNNFNPEKYFNLLSTYGLLAFNLPVETELTTSQLPSNLPSTIVQLGSNLAPTSSQLPSNSIVEPPETPVALHARTNGRTDGRTNTPLTPQGESGDKKKKINYPDWFESFWKIYPKSSKKAHSYECAKRHRLSNHVAQVLSSISAHCKTPQWQKDGGLYVPDFSTFINRKMWLDEPASGPNGTTNAEPLHVRLFNADKAKHIHGGYDGEPATITIADWVYIPKGYCGTEDGLQHKQTSEMVPLKHYRPIRKEKTE